MTEDQFRRWYRAHVAAFPSVHSWLGSYPKEPVDDRPSQRDILRTWFDVLALEGVEDCLQATRSLATGSAELPRLPEDHCRSVRRMAGDLRAKKNREAMAAVPVGRDIAYRCLVCFDSGAVSCWHPRAMQAMRAGKFGDKFSRYTCAVRCPCDNGEKRFPWLEQVYDRNVWIALTIDREADVAALREWSENFVPHQWRGGF